MTKQQIRARILAAVADTTCDFNSDSHFGGLGETIGDGITVEDPRDLCPLDLIWEAAGETGDEAAGETGDETGDETEPPTENPEGWREVTA